MRLFHMPVMLAALLGAAVVESAAAQGGVRGCDRNFFVQEMGLVNWVRDRFDSDVHLLLTGLNAANGGRQITVNFLGQKGYAGKVDTLTITTLPNDADDRVRRELLRTFQLGLAPYVARTPIASRLRGGLVNGVVAPSLNAKAVKDRWNLWLYRVDGNLSANGEQLVRSTNLSSTVSAARTTDNWKINIGATGSYNERDFKIFQANAANPSLRDTVSVIVLQRASNANALFGRTINAHWTAGVKVSAGFSEVLNQKLALRVSPAIEYNCFPWTEATRRQLTALYYVGPNYYQYYSTTVFGQDEETRVNQTLLLALTQRHRTPVRVPERGLTWRRGRCRLNADGRPLAWCTVAPAAARSAGWCSRHESLQRPEILHEELLTRAGYTGL